YLREALQRIKKPMIARRLSIFVGIAELFLQTGQSERGIELLALALHHPASDQDTKERAQDLLNHFSAAVQVIDQTNLNIDLEAVTTTLLDELLIPEDTTLTHHSPQSQETLVEPLSERELEVLKLIADGLSNREIADQLFLSVATVKWYLTHIY